MGLPKRRGKGTPLYDWGPFTLSALSNWWCDGSHRWPTVSLIFRDRWTKPSCTGVGRATVYRRLTLPLPYVMWRTGYRHRSLMPVNRLFDRFYRSWIKR